MAGVASTPAREALRAEVEEAVEEAIGRLGPEGLVPHRIARRFVGRGVSLPTLIRWIGAVVQDGSAGRRHAARIKKAAADRAARAADPAADAAREAAAMMPALPTIHEITGAGSTIDIVAGLQRCLLAAGQVMDYSTTPDGRVRVPRLLLQAAELQRRCLETAVRLNEALRDIAALDRFHSALVAEVAKESPAVAERLTWRLRAMTSVFTDDRDAESFPASDGLS